MLFFKKNKSKLDKFELIVDLLRRCNPYKQIKFDCFEVSKINISYWIKIGESNKEYNLRDFVKSPHADYFIEKLKDFVQDYKNTRLKEIKEHEENVLKNIDLDMKSCNIRN